MTGIVGIGVDVVSISRFTAVLARSPRLAERLFTAQELRTADGVPRRPDSLAARFAAKEAVAKALGAPTGLTWHDCVVVVDDTGRPGLELHGSVAAAADGRGVRATHLSLSHDGDVAIAQVILEGGG